MAGDMVVEMRIIIDPGHGGPDTGAVGLGTIEAEVNYGIAVEVGRILERWGHNPIFTRGKTPDQKISLVSRVRLANEQKADAFISVHANSSKNTKARGFEVWHWHTSTRAAELSRLICRWMSAEFRTLPNRGVKQSSPKNNPLYVLSATAMPAVLVECGFLSNPVDELLLRDTQNWQRFGRAIAKGWYDWASVTHTSLAHDYAYRPANSGLTIVSRNQDGTDNDRRS